jgi:hypothetical protein
MQMAKTVIFFVFFTASLFSVTAGNTHTLTTNGDPVLMKLYTNMYVVLDDGSLSLADGTASTYYPTYHNAVDGQDAKKLNTFSTNESLCILREGVQLAIERRQTIVGYDTTFLQVSQMGTRRYVFQFIAQNFDPFTVAYLKDDLAGTAYPINLMMTDTTKYFFDVNTTNGYAKEINRFSIVYRPAGDLPVNFTGVNVFEQNKAVNIGWNVENEMNIDQYNIERSVNGIDFSRIGSLHPTPDASGKKQYTWIDFTPANGNNFYRINDVSKSGTNTYSKTVKITLNNSLSDVKIYPTVVNNGNVDMQLITMKKGVYTLRLINATGQTVFTKNINHPGGNATENISIDNQHSTGIYQLNIVGPDNYFTSVKILSR